MKFVPAAIAPPIVPTLVPWYIRILDGFYLFFWIAVSIMILLLILRRIDKKRINTYSFGAYICAGIAWLFYAIESYRNSHGIMEILLFCGFIVLTVFAMNYIVIKNKLKLRKNVIEEEKGKCESKIKKCYKSMIIFSAITLILAIIIDFFNFFSIITPII